MVPRRVVGVATFALDGHVIPQNRDCVVEALDHNICREFYRLSSICVTTVAPLITQHIIINIYGSIIIISFTYI